MSGKKTRAVGTAPKRKHQFKSYNRYSVKSSTKIKDDLGELLWSLQFSIDGELERRGWEVFERLLRQYIGIVHARRSDDRQAD